MNSQLSVDIIYTILFSITEHTVGRPKSKDWRKYEMYDFMNGDHLTGNQNLIESMIVRNPNQLKVA